jgi:hypothetical protein
MILQNQTVLDQNIASITLSGFLDQVVFQSLSNGAAGCLLAVISFGDNYIAGGDILTCIGNSFQIPVVIIGTSKLALNLKYKIKTRKPKGIYYLETTAGLEDLVREILSAGN